MLKPIAATTTATPIEMTRSRVGFTRHATSARSAIGSRKTGSMTPKYMHASH